MVNSFLSAMQAWREQLNVDLKKYWWGPLVGFVMWAIERLAEHRIWAFANEYIDAHWIEAIKRHLWILADPVLRAIVIPFALVLLPILAIVVHAYFATRPNKEEPRPTVPPAEALTDNDPRIRVEAISATIEKAPWRETRFIFHNEGGSTAYRTQMDAIDLSSLKPGKAEVSTRTEETIPSAHSATLIAMIQTQLPLFVNDTVPFLKWELEASFSSEVVKHIAIRYFDYAGQQFETSADLVYVPVLTSQAEINADFENVTRQYHRKNALEVIVESEERRTKASELTIRNHRFRKIVSESPKQPS